MHTENGDQPSHHVDIMLPCYGDAQPVKEAIQSVLGQRADYWRLTVIDDGVQPEIERWVAALADDRVRYLRNAETLGVSGNFNRCVDLATADLVTLFGCDDIMLPGYVDTVTELAREQESAAAVHPASRVINEHGEPIYTLVDMAKQHVYAPRISGTRVMGGEKLARSLLRGNWMYFPAICWRREVLRHLRFRTDLRMTQDLALMLHTVQMGSRIAFSDRMCVSYRRHTGSVSGAGASNGSRFREEHDFFLAAAASMDDLGWRRAAYVARIHLASRIHALSKIPGAVRQGHADVARELFHHAFA